MNDIAAEKLEEISPQEFAHLGMEEVAYIREVFVNGVAGFSVHAADGTPIGVLRDRAGAIAAVHELDLDLASVH